jgi:hypothetical protein
MDPREPFGPVECAGSGGHGMEAVCPLCAPNLRHTGSLCIVSNSPDAGGRLLQPQEEPSQREGQGFESP